MRKGIHAAGTFLIDKIKIIDSYPEEGMLVNIQSELIGTGGGPFNVLVNFAKFEVDIPLFATAVIGDDDNGKRIMNNLQKYGINTTGVAVHPSARSSYTDVLSSSKTGQRTFFHHRGSNGSLGIEHFQNLSSNAKIFHLAYLLLLDSLEKADKDFKIVAARILHDLQREGYKTSVDLISENSTRYFDVVRPCLPYTDYLVINEVEAASTAGTVLRDSNGEVDQESLKHTAATLFELGVNEIVCIHFPEGAYARSKDGMEEFHRSYFINENEIKGTNGAGDAFCAGMLYGIHEDYSLVDSLKIAQANARFNLLSPTCVDGIVPIKELKEFIKHNDT